MWLSDLNVVVIRPIDQRRRPSNVAFFVSLQQKKLFKYYLYKN